MSWSRIKHWWSDKLHRVQDEYDETREDLARSHWQWRLAAGLVGLWLLLVLLLGVWWSRTPGVFDVAVHRDRVLESHQLVAVPGSTLSITLVRVAGQLLDKPGGYLSNDIAPPGVWLDNMPNWEYGVLVQVRDLAKAMRESFSRSQSQSREDVDLILAEPRFNFDNDSWIFPASESQYRDAIHYLNRYLKRLSAGDARFFARADNLNYWLATVETRLGDLSQRLSASVGQTPLGGEAAGQVTKTPWSELDDVLFEARGSAWALIHLLKAVEVDFRDVLDKKNATVSLQQIIRELEATQQPLWSPVVLNGSGFGFWPNHSLVMASYISRANAAIIDLRRLLNQG